MTTKTGMASNLVSTLRSSQNFITERAIKNTIKLFHNNCSMKKIKRKFNVDEKFGDFGESITIQSGQKFKCKDGNIISINNADNSAIVYTVTNSSGQQIAYQSVAPNGFGAILTQYGADLTPVQPSSSITQPTTQTNTSDYSWITAITGGIKDVATAGVGIYKAWSEGELIKQQAEAQKLLQEQMTNTQKLLSSAQAQVSSIAQSAGLIQQPIVSATPATIQTTPTQTVSSGFQLISADGKKILGYDKNIVIGIVLVLVFLYWNSKKSKK